MKGRSHPARRIAHGALAALLAFGLTPTAAFADEQSADGESARNDTGVIEQLATQQQERWDAALATGDLRILTDESIYNAEDDGALLEAREALPSSYDLRDKGVVTPVKRQNPWGTCWGFAAIAASRFGGSRRLRRFGTGWLWRLRHFKIGIIFLAHRYICGTKINVASKI